MKRTIVASTLVLWGLGAGQAHAWGLGVRAGAQGLGADLGLPLGDDWSLRFGVSAFDWNRSLNVTDVRYDAKLRLQNASALLEWHPLGPFRLSAGIVPTRNRIEVRGEPIDTRYRINGTVYDAAEIRDLRGEIRTGRSLAPYIGLGYGIVARRGFNVYIDLGAIYQGSPTARLSAGCGPSLTVERCAQLKRDVRAEQRELAASVRNFKWFPVANVGVTIGF
jgi:hypothetical protein